MTSISSYRLKQVALPFLVTVFFVLDSRSSGLMAWRDLPELMVICLLFSLLLYVVIRYFVGEATKSGVLTVLVLVQIYFYDILSRYLILSFQFVGINLVHKTAYPALILLGVLAAIVILFSRTRRDLALVNTYLTLLMTAYIVFDVGQILLQSHQVGTRDLENYLADPPPAAQTVVRQKILQSGPDVYYIILDSYTSPASLKNYWHFGDSEFVEYLRSKGFAVTTESESSYSTTWLSVAASLNMSDITASKMSGLELVQLIKLIRNNKVSELFTSLGYEIINLSMFDILDKPKAYSAVGYAAMNSPKDYLFDRTLVGRLYTRLRLNDFYRVNLRLLSTLEGIPGQPREVPRFVYAHIFLPHHPYSFDRQGNVIPWFRRGNINDMQSYLDQLIYTNTRMQNIIEQLLSTTNKKPVIIIQGDHGFRFLDSTDKAKEATSIFNAFYFPAGHSPFIPNSVNPVNSFRIVFNEFFGTHFDILGDGNMLKQRNGS